jgi:hypothetical protein
MLPERTNYSGAPATNTVRGALFGPVIFTNPRPFPGTYDFSSNPKSQQTAAWQA